MVKGGSLSFIWILSIVQSGVCTYDCIKLCACENTDGVLIANCDGLNFTEVPHPEPAYHVNILHLQYNQITTLRMGNFLLFPVLTELYLQGNRLSVIEERAFDGLRSLQKLDMSSNMIHFIPGKEAEVFESSLTWLSLAMNGLRHLPASLKNMTKLEFLDVSNNKFIKELSSAPFPSTLTKLDMGYTGVKFYPKSVFDNLIDLKTLILSDSMASSSLKFEDGAFDELSSLEYMDLSRSFCKKISRNSFAMLKNLKTLIMNNCWLAQPPIFARRELKDLITLDAGFTWKNVSSEITYSPTSQPPHSTSTQATENTSTPNPGQEVWYNPELAILDLSNNRRMSIEPGKVRFPPSLTDLRLSSTRLKNLDGDMFNETILIQKLDLSNARLRTIAGGTFSHFRNISEIDLSGNPLGSVPSLPSSMLSLELSETRIINISRTIFVNLTNVIEANLMNGEIDWIEDFAFENMVSMQTLNLSENKIDRLQRNALMIGKTGTSKEELNGQNKLSKLNLASNLLRSIEEGAFSSLSQLHTLDLQGNFLTVVESRLFAGLQNLVDLNLNGNSIVDITPNSLDYLSNLEVLHLEDNNLEIIFPELFEKMHALKQLLMARNMLALVHEITSPSLTFVDISNNNLTTFPQIGGISLREIKASHNPFEAFTPGALRKAPNLQILDISRAYIAYMNYSELSGCSKLKTLDLTGNHVINFLDVKMPSLDALVLGENDIQRVENNLQDVCPMITTLDLRYNKVSYLNPTVFSGAPKLSRVDLSGNSFLCDCNLSPLVAWMTKNIHVMMDARSYACNEPVEDFGKSVLDTVSALNCKPPSTGVNRADLYIILGVAVGFLAIAFLILAWALRRRAARQGMREEEMLTENGEPMLGESDETRETSNESCCSSLTCFVRSRSRADGNRDRVESDDRGDLMVSSPITSPSQKEAPVSL